MLEEAWVWITRACAVGGFIYLLATIGFNAPWGAYILLIGLFFGPDALKGNIGTFTVSRNREGKNDKDDRT